MPEECPSWRRVCSRRSVWVPSAWPLPSPGQHDPHGPHRGGELIVGSAGQDRSGFLVGDLRPGGRAGERVVTLDEQTTSAVAMDEGFTR